MEAPVGKDLEVHPVIQEEVALQLAQEEEALEEVAPQLVQEVENLQNNRQLLNLNLQVPLNHHRNKVMLPNLDLHLQQSQQALVNPHKNLTHQPQLNQPAQENHLQNRHLLLSQPTQEDNPQTHRVNLAKSLLPMEKINNLQERNSKAKERTRKEVKSKRMVKVTSLKMEVTKTRTEERASLLKESNRRNKKVRKTRKTTSPHKRSNKRSEQSIQSMKYTENPDVIYLIDMNET